MKKNPLGAGSKDQSARFIETTRQQGPVENEAIFKAKLAVSGRQKPKKGIERG